MTVAGTWTQENLDRLVRLRHEGFTSNRIAADMGITRNAVCGKLHRMGIMGERKPKPPKVKPMPVSEPAPAPVQSAPEAPTRPSVHLLDRTEGQCKWPAWDNQEAPTLLYCGAPRQAESPYCPEHTRRAWSSAASREAGRKQAAGIIAGRK